MLYSRAPLVIHSKYNSSHLLIPNFTFVAFGFGIRWKKILTNFAACVIFWEFYCLRFYTKVFVGLLLLSHWVTSDYLQSMHCSLPGSSGYGISQARILQWVAIFFYKGSSQPRDQSQVSCLAGGFLTTESLEKPIKIFNEPLVHCELIFESGIR